MLWIWLSRSSVVAEIPEPRNCVFDIYEGRTIEMNRVRGTTIVIAEVRCRACGNAYIPGYGVLAS